jgi:hypothetical protein
MNPAVGGGKGLIFCDDCKSKEFGAEYVFTLDSLLNMG